MRIAIVGSGISGLVAARGLHREHDITVFEADTRVGGHTHTWDVRLSGRSYAVDTGFIVYNERNYPNFTRLLSDLGVATQPSTMSFSVRHDAAGLEYNGSSLRQLFVQWRNVLRPSFHLMLSDVLRFNRSAMAEVEDGSPGMTLGDLLDNGRYSRVFREWFLLPMGSAIWSLPSARVLDMPARFFVRFFENHGMLTVNDRPQWRVIRGGSRRYTEALISPFADRIRLASPVRRVTRDPHGVLVDGERFDRVVLACHSDQALALLGDPSPTERTLLGALPYQPNDAVLHTDTTVLPRNRAAWGAWNYWVAGDGGAPARVTYNMNELQSLDAPETLCVTLNHTETIDPVKIIGWVRYEHPMFTIAGVDAAARRSLISGRRHTHFCGAYWGNGFHEDGVVSGLEVVREIGQAARAPRENVA